MNRSAARPVGARRRSPWEGTVLIGEGARWSVRPDERKACRLARALLDAAGTSNEIEIGPGEAGACRIDLDAVRFEVGGEGDRDQVTAMTPSTLVSNTERISSSDAALRRPACTISSIDRPAAGAWEMPALLTSTSRRPSSSRMRSAAAVIEDWSVTSSRTARASPWIAFAAASPRSRSRDPTRTVRSCAARSLAICRPMPLLAPVTRATGVACTMLSLQFADRLSGNGSTDSG